MGLTSALAEIVHEIDGISGIRASTDDPPETISVFPSAIVYSTGASYLGTPIGSMPEIHTVRIDLIVARLIVPVQVTKLTALAREIPNALYRKQRYPLSGLAGFGFETVGDSIACTLLTANWGGTDMLVYRYELTVKIIEVIS